MRKATGHKPDDGRKDGTRELRDLDGIGKSIEANLHRLGVNSVAQLARQDAEELYGRLGRLEGAQQDPCVLDVFRCAVAQATDPHLRPERRKWWWWSQQRKAGRLPGVAAAKRPT